MASVRFAASSLPRRAVVMNDVARAAGVHVTTVSLALRNSPQLPPATRERIRALAEKMGYRVNPLLAALVRQRRTSRPGRFQGVIGFVTRSTIRYELRANPYVGHMYAAASVHAESLGFKLEHFEFLDYGQDAARLEKALHARGIRGLFFPPSQVPEGDTLDLHWEHFSCATFSTNLRIPAMDRIDTDHFGAAWQAAQACLDRGYRRIGYISVRSSDIASRGRWRGGYLAFSQAQTGLKPLPALVADDDAFEAEFRRWHRRWRPDAILANNIALSRALRVLEDMGIAVPAATAAASVNLYRPEGPQSGMCVCLEESSRRTVDQIVGRLYRNQLGLPDRPAIILTPPVWHEGSTLPARTKVSRIT